MAVVNWDPNLPSGSSAVRLGDNDIRSLTTSIQQALASEHSFVAGPSEEERGRHTPNASRVSFGASAPRHNQLESGQSGFMFLETGGGVSRLLVAYPGSPSVTSVPIGGQRVLHNALNPAVAQVWVQSVFTAVSGSARSLGVTYVSDTEPIVTATAAANVFTHIGSIDSANVTINATTDAGIASNGDVVHVHVMGEVALSEL